MQYIDQIITGIDGTEARFIGYAIDNSPEIDPARRRPAVLVIPGGGYAMTSDREAEPIALKFVGTGYNAFVLRYSCEPSRYPTSLCEAAEAMRLIRDHADEWHTDPDRIAVIGFSAGGHLAANLATSVGDDDLAVHGYDPDAARPNALMLAYPVITSGELAHRGSFDALLGPDRKDDPAWLDKLSLGTIETAWEANPACMFECIQAWPQLACDWLKRTFARRTTRRQVRWDRY